MPNFIKYHTRLDVYRQIVREIFNIVEISSAEIDATKIFESH